MKARDRFRAYLAYPTKGIERLQGEHALSRFLDAAPLAPSLSSAERSQSRQQDEAQGERPSCGNWPAVYWRQWRWRDEGGGVQLETRVRDVAQAALRILLDAAPQQAANAFPRF
jgi:hypothetical protein